MAAPKQIMVALTDIVVEFVRENYPNADDWFIDGFLLPEQSKVLGVLIRKC